MSTLNFNRAGTAILIYFTNVYLLKQVLPIIHPESLVYVRNFSPSLLKR